MSLVRKGRGLLYFNVLFEGFVRKSSSFSFLLSFKYVQIIIFPFVSPCCGKVDKNTLQGTGRELSAAKFIQDVSESQFGKIKSLEGDWYLVDDSKNTPFITYEITSAGNAVIEKLFAGEPKEMTTIYYMELGRLTMAHYCSLGNQPYLVALPSNSEQDIKFEFVRLGNMKDVNEHHIYTHKLEFQDENEMAAHCGGWKDQAPYKEDRVFRVKR